MMILRASKQLVLLCLLAFVMQAVPVWSQSNPVEPIEPPPSALLNQLRADYAALLDARIDFEQLESSPGAPDQEQADYADWIQQLSAQFANDCRELAEFSSASIPADIPCGEFVQTFTIPAEIDTVNENSHGEKVASVESRFNQSLGNFDEKLLREQDRVKARRPQDSRADSGSGAAGGGSHSSMGSGESAASGADSNESDMEAEDSEASMEAASGGDTGGDQDASSPSPGSSGSSAPPDTPDGKNDDVIARQLREAAEKETDPELKRKLWEEYKRYKEGI